MGVTSKNLTYPEPTIPARIMPGAIQLLATDTNTVLTAHDTRFSGLDGKTNTTDSNLANRNQVIARYGHCAGVYTHLPNDGVLRTVSQHTDQFFVPATATRAIVSMMSTAFSTVNAAGAWYPLVTFTPGGNSNWEGLGEYAVHNQTQPAIDLGYYACAEFNVENHNNVWGSVAVNAYCAAQSGNWITCGPMRWSVTLIG